MMTNRIGRRSRQGLLYIGISFIFYTSGSLFTGCATIEQTTYLQELRTVTSVSEPPLQLNADSSERYVHITPRVSYSTENVMIGQLEGAGPYKTSDRNLQWRIPSVSMAIDVDWRISTRIALVGSIHLAETDHEWVYGTGMGMGLLFGGEHLAGRLDFGLQLHIVSYQASSIVVTEGTGWFGSWRDVSYYTDDGKSSALTEYVSLMINTTFSESPVNGFLQIALGGQQLADFGPERQLVLGILVNGTKTDARVQSSSLYVMFSPGFYINLMPSLRLIGGVRLVWEPGIKDPEPGSLVLPVVQFEVVL